MPTLPAPLPLRLGTDHRRVTSRARKPAMASPCRDVTILPQATTAQHAQAQRLRRAAGGGAGSQGRRSGSEEQERPRGPPKGAQQRARRSAARAASLAAPCLNRSGHPSRPSLARAQPAALHLRPSFSSRLAHQPSLPSSAPSRRVLPPHHPLPTLRQVWDDGTLAAPLAALKDDAGEGSPVPERGDPDAADPDFSLEKEQVRCAPALCVLHGMVTGCTIGCSLPVRGGLLVPAVTAQSLQWLAARLSCPAHPSPTEQASEEGHASGGTAHGGAAVSSGHHAHSHPHGADSGEEGEVPYSDDSPRVSV